MAAGLWVAVWWLIPRQGQLIPIHYTIYFGIDLTGGWRTWLWLPGVATVAALISFIASSWSEEAIWIRTWWLVALLVNVLLVAAFVATYLTYLQNS